MADDVLTMEQLQDFLGGGWGASGPPVTQGEGEFNLGDFGPYDSSFPANDTGYGGAGDPSRIMVYDNQTGETITLAEAMQRDPVAARQLNDVSGVTEAQTAPSMTVPIGQQSELNNPPAGAGGGFLSNLLKTATGDPLKAIGLALTGGTSLAGLGMAIAGMTRSANGSGTIKLPDGRTVALSPQETQLLDAVARQVQQQADISDVTLPMLRQAATTAAPDIQSTLAGGTGTAAAQTGGQRQITDAANAALAPSAAPIFAGDLANERGLQGAQGLGIQNISDVLQADRAPAGQYGDLSPDVASLGHTAADFSERALRGDVSADPYLQRQLEIARKERVDRLLRELGPGALASTFGEETLRNFDIDAAAKLAGDVRNQASIAQPFVTSIPSLNEMLRSGRYGRATTLAGSTGRGTSTVGNISELGQRGAPTSGGSISTLLGERPGTLALGGAGAYANVGNQQAGINANLTLQQALLDFQKNQGLMQTGGNLVGYGTSPFLYQFAKSLTGTPAT